jgi:hypothetical protein
MSTTVTIGPWTFDHVSYDEPADVVYLAGVNSLMGPGTVNPLQDTKKASTPLIQWLAMCVEQHTSAT